MFTSPCARGQATSGQRERDASSLMRVLLIGTGSRGGVGRYEQLLHGALDELTCREELEWRGVWRRAHPDYLGSSHASQTTGDGSIRALVRCIARTARGWRPDVVCFTHVNLARLGPLLPLMGIRAPYVVGALGVEVWSQLHWTKRIPLLRASSVFSISDYTRDQVRSVQGVPVDRTTTLHLALEDHWRASADTLLSAPIFNAVGEAGRCSILSVCRLEQEARDKGVDWVLRGVAQLALAFPQLRYTVVGDGDDRVRLEALAAALDIRDRVVFTGSLDHHGLLAAYRDCDLFVLPTRREGFGLVFLEAMAFRKPIVAMATAGTLDVVTPGREGLLIDAEHELVGAIAKLIREPALAMRMGEEGYRSVAGYFSFDAFVSRLSGVMSKACEGHPPDLRAQHARHP